MVSRSLTEAEYRVMAAIVQELILLKKMVCMFGVRHDKPMIVQCDKKSMIYIATNHVFMKRQHIELDFHLFIDEVLTRIILFHHVDTRSKLADIFTKSISRDCFWSFRSKLGIRNLYAPA